MFSKKFSVGFAAAIISLAVMALPAAAEAGETDQAAGGIVESTYVHTGTARTPLPSSGETDAWAEQASESHSDSNSGPITRDDVVVYVDGMGATDQSARTSDSDAVVTGIKVTRGDIANVANNGRRFDETIVLAIAGETDQHAGMDVVQVSSSQANVFTLLRRPDRTPTAA